MKRYEPECWDGTLFLVAGDERVKIGNLDDIVDLVGGETYVIEYDERQRKQPWLDTDDGVLEIDVHDSVTTITHTEALVAELRKYDMGTDRYGLPERTVKFANLLVGIFERQGSS